MTKRVVTVAVALARAVSGRVVLLNVAQPVARVADYTAFLDNIAEVNDRVARAARRQLLKMATRLRATYERVEAVQLAGPPVPLVLEQVKRLRAADLVIDSHGHTAIYNLIVGGTAGGILKNATYPVVVVPPPVPKKVPAKRK